MTPKLIRHFIAVALWAVVLPITANSLDAPPAATQARSEIDEQVWRPLLKAMNAMDADEFAALLSTDVVQVSADRKLIRGRDEFVALIRESYARARARGLARTVEFRSLGRIESGSLAYESGYIKTTFAASPDELKTSYGAFQVVMRRERDRWKLLVDYDASTIDGRPITAAMFAQASPL